MNVSPNRFTYMRRNEDMLKTSVGEKLSSRRISIEVSKNYYCDWISDPFYLRIALKENSTLFLYCRNSNVCRRLSQHIHLKFAVIYFEKPVMVLKTLFNLTSRYFKKPLLNFTLIRKPYLVNYSLISSSTCLHSQQLKPSSFKQYPLRNLNFHQKQIVSYGSTFW